MTREDIIRMAREVEWLHQYDSTTGFVAEAAFKFAALVASAEREEILAFASSEAFNRQHGERSPYAYELANAIRARGQA
jgi:hypothetical protein